MKKRNIIILTILTIFSLPLSSCNKEESGNLPPRKIYPIRSAYMTFADNENVKFTTKQQYPFGDTIKINFPKEYPEGSGQDIDISEMKLTLTLNDGIKLLSKNDEIIDLNEPYTVTLLNIDKLKQKIVIVADGGVVSKSNKFEIGKGVNVSSWLSGPKYDGDRRVAFFNENNVKQLREQGFDHIRLSIDEEVLWDVNGNKIYPYAFDLLHSAISWCIKHDMRIIVDMHTTRNHHFTNNENDLFTEPGEPEKFVKLWESLSAELSKYPNSTVAYELLNEPVTANAEDWNKVSEMAIEAIRKSEPRRTIIVGVCTSNFTVMYKTLKLPKDDNLLMTFHFYAPYLLTAYGQDDTTDGRTDIPIQYPGQLVPDSYILELPQKWQSTGRQTFNKEELLKYMLEGVNRAKELNVPVFVGEFGTLYTVPETSRNNWYRDVVSILNEYKLPYTSWDYKGYGYSIIGENNEVLYPDILKILTGR